ncbi:MAG: response regulator [Methanomicrobiales archaeon]|jgi:PAS domain S-box-containing protein
MEAAIRILYVDDEPDLLNIGKLFLEESGEFIVTTALSAQEGIRLLEQKKFDAIISDYQMPGMDGIQFLVEVRTRFGPVPFILFTGRGREEVVIQAINSGVDFYLQKGGEPNAQFAELLCKVKSAVTGRSERSLRESKEETLVESERRFRMLLQHVPSIAIQGYNMEGITQYWNEAAEKLYGYTSEEAIGKNLIDLIIPPEMKGHVSEAITYMKETSQPIPAAELFLMRKDGTRIEVFSHHALIKSPGSGMELFCIDIDITERKKIEEALLRANKKLNLLYSITRHDINNQLTVIGGFMDMLERKEHDPTLDEYFQTVSTAAKRIAGMIRFTGEYEKIGVHAPVWQNALPLVNTAAIDAPLGKIMVKNDLPAGAEIFADQLIGKVFYNLMDNAVRYGGKITSIRFSVEEAGDCHLIVCDDDGDGVVAVEKEKIFERGFGKNTGLGLALSREILSITGITIKETGEPGKGARFEMAVPKGAWK